MRREQKQRQCIKSILEICIVCFPHTENPGGKNRSSGLCEIVKRAQRSRGTGGGTLCYMVWTKASAKGSIMSQRESVCDEHVDVDVDVDVDGSERWERRRQSDWTDLDLPAGTANQGQHQQSERSHNERLTGFQRAGHKTAAATKWLLPYIYVSCGSGDSPSPTKRPVV